MDLSVDRGSGHCVAAGPLWRNERPRAAARAARRDARAARVGRLQRSSRLDLLRGNRCRRWHWCSTKNASCAVAENVFVLNERVFVSNMAFSVVFLGNDGGELSRGPRRRGERMKRRAFLAAAAGAAAAGTARAGAQIPLPNQQFLQQLTVGVNVTLSGPLESTGPTSSAARKRPSTKPTDSTAPINHVLGLRAFDDRNDAALAATNANVAASDPSVIGIVGNLTAPDDASGALALCERQLCGRRSDRYGRRHHGPQLSTTSFDCRPTIARRAGFSPARCFRKRRAPRRSRSRSTATTATTSRADSWQQAKADRHAADVLLFPATGIDPGAAARTVLDRKPGYVFLCGKTAAARAARRSVAPGRLHRRFRRERRLL